MQPGSLSMSKTGIIMFNRKLISNKKCFILFPELRGSRPTRPSQSLHRRVGCECAQTDLAATSDRNSEQKTRSMKVPPKKGEKGFRQP